MNKYLFIFKHQNILIYSKNKLSAINTINDKYPNILDNDFEIITINIEINSKGELI